ncbi:MAG: hypothetical protein PF637_05895 [Spirochaetes bacterium]|jgi:ribosomal protein S18 acetylase RimI-like enzyme|nr:hypothetical protein [Spirochaetota bacterium]
MKCTWKGCDNQADIKLYNKLGFEWANLCNMHNQELEKAIQDKDVRRIMRSWVLANGGASELAKKI